MKITITLSNNKTQADYQLNDDMPIQTALQIINDNDQLEIPQNIKYVYSKRKKEKISI